MEIILSELAEACNGRLVSARAGGDFKVSGISTDTRTLRRGDVFIALKGPNYDGHGFICEAFERGASAAVVSETACAGRPGAGGRVLLVADSSRALTDIAGYYRGKFAIPVIGITGSDGKTTVREMLAGILSREMNVLSTDKNFNNKIGVSLTLLRLEPRHEACVLEMGMSEKGEIRFLAEIARPDTAVITGVGFAHLGNFPNREGIAAAKAELLEGADRAVLNIDDDYYEFLRARAPADVRTFVLGADADFRAADIARVEGGQRFLLNGKLEVFLPLKGVHNVLNALCAVAAASCLGTGPEQAVRGLSRLSPLPMRLNSGEFGDVRVIDDSYNANPRSVLAALEVLSEEKGRKIIVLGDMLELGCAARELHEKIGKKAAEKADILFAAGHHAESVSEAAKEAGMRNTRFFKNSGELIPELLREIRPGDAVLVKGSRGARMESVVEALARKAGG